MTAAIESAVGQENTGVVVGHGSNNQDPNKHEAETSQDPLLNGEFFKPRSTNVAKTNRPAKNVGMRCSLLGLHSRRLRLMVCG